MGYTNSKLVNYTKLSPNHSGTRKHAIDTITIHCVVGQVSVEGLGAIFASKAKEASSNYGIGKDGRIGLYVEEKNRSWCSSSVSNDNRAVTIEVASDTKSPYKVNDAAYKSLIKLVADICQRNGIKKLLWKGDKSLIGQVSKQNMTVHRWFAAKSCPGDYLYSHHSDIAKQVNAILSPSTSSSTNTSSSSSIKVGDTVRVKSGAKTYDGKALASFVYTRDHKVSSISGSRAVITYGGTVVAAVNTKDLTKKSSTTSATSSTSKTVTASSVGKKVKLSSSATIYGTSTKFQSWVYKSTLYLRELNGSRAVISTQKTGDVTGAVDKKYLTLA